LLDQPDLHTTLAQRGRERVLAHFTQRALAQTYYDVYREMLEDGVIEGRGNRE
jgi:hypothetical protein